MEQVKIETKRLLLTPVSDDEMRTMIDAEADPGMKQAYSEMLQGCLDHPSLRIWNAVWLMTLRDRPGTVVGDFSFKGLGKDGVVEIGYGLKPGFCGHGYMTEAVSAVSAWAASQPGVARVEAETEPDNKASQRVLAGAGYIATGTIGAEGPRFVWNEKP